MCISSHYEAGLESGQKRACQFYNNYATIASAGIAFHEGWYFSSQSSQLRKIADDFFPPSRIHKPQGLRIVIHGGINYVHLFLGMNSNTIYKLTYFFLHSTLTRSIKIDPLNLTR